MRAPSANGSSCCARGAHHEQRARSRAKRIMSSVLDLARPDLRKLRPYVPGAYEPGLVRLNANESPWRAPGDTTERGLNIYPPPRPFSLRDRLAAHYGARQQDV